MERLHKTDATRGAIRAGSYLVSGKVACARVKPDLPINKKNQEHWREKRIRRKMTCYDNIILMHAAKKDPQVRANKAKGALGAYARTLPDTLASLAMERSDVSILSYGWMETCRNGKQNDQQEMQAERKEPASQTNEQTNTYKRNARTVQERTRHNTLVYSERLVPRVGFNCNTPRGANDTRHSHPDRGGR